MIDTEKSITGHHKVYAGVAAIALCLSFCRPGFESQAQHLRFPFSF